MSWMLQALSDYLTEVSLRFTVGEEKSLLQCPSRETTGDGTASPSPHSPSFAQAPLHVKDHNEASRASSRPVSRRILLSTWVNWHINEVGQRLDSA